MTARFIAATLALPLVTIDLATVMSSYLGRTGQNLRAALDHGRQSPSVVLLDEFDALAKRRDDDSDIGELKRLVNVLLLELERWPSSSLLLAATNHRHLLDRAVERRFDLVIELDLPGTSQRTAILRQAWQWEPLGDELLEALSAASEGASGSDLGGAAAAAAKQALLDGADPRAALANQVVSRCKQSTTARDGLVVLLHESLHLSNRELASLLGVSHPTVGAALKRTRGRSLAAEQ